MERVLFLKPGDQSYDLELVPRPQTPHLESCSAHPSGLVVVVGCMCACACVRVLGGRSDKLEDVKALYSTEVTSEDPEPDSLGSSPGPHQLCALGWDTSLCIRSHLCKMGMT